MATFTALVLGIHMFWVAVFLGATIFQMFSHWTGHGDDGLTKLWTRLARLHQDLWLFAGVGGFWWLYIDVKRGQTGIQLALDVCGVLFWWLSRNWPDDNEWKKRFKKAKSKVAQLGGKLVVVPASS